MDRKVTRNSLSTFQDGPASSRNETNRENIDLLRVLQGMMESQQQQIDLLYQGLMTIPREQRPGNVSELRRLQPAIFTGSERLLEAEQWLIDTTDLLRGSPYTCKKSSRSYKVATKRCG